MKEFFQKFTPLQIAGATFLILLLSTLAVRYFGQTDQSAADYDVVYQTRRVKKAQTQAQAKIDDFQQKLTGEPNFRYGERLREASVLMVSLSVSEYFDRLKSKRIEHKSLSQVIEAVKQKKLLPAEFRFNYSNEAAAAAATSNGVYYLRYSVYPFGLEVVSVGGRGFEDGEIFILRIPDAGRVKRKSTEEAELSSASLWVAPFADTFIPAPFSDASVYRQAGWKQETIQINDYQKP